MDDSDLRQYESDPDGEKGKPYRGWREGDFDVHMIDVGIAEANFHIYPDGTTALVDCGDRNPASRGDAGLPPRPDGSRRAGEWVARYVARLTPGADSIDYLIATHFHRDHIGSLEFGAGWTTGRGRDYQLSGIAQVGEFFRFGVAYDRGYPHYSGIGAKIRRDAGNFRRFLEYQERARGLRREPFRVGAADQIRLLHAPKRYDFHTRNVCGNGMLWTGEGERTLDLYAAAGLEDRRRLENTMSLGISYRYGAFHFFTGGDMMNENEGENFDERIDFEGALGRVLGRQDVCKANHHASRGSTTRGFANAVQARAYLVNVWQKKHLRLASLYAMGDDSQTGYPGPRLICPTRCLPEQRSLAARCFWGRYLAKRSGHVVAKAYAGGAKFKIYYLTSEDESMRVDAVYGPFDSRGDDESPREIVSAVSRA